MSKPILHGENFLEVVDRIPEGETKKLKKYIAGHSETGHHHIVESDVAFDVVTDMAKQVFLKVDKQAKITHKKSFDIHETLTIEPGMYRVRHKTEYNPFTKVIQRVWD